MPTPFELRLEIPFSAPENPAVVSSRLKEAISEAALDSGVREIVKEGNVEPTFGQQLPTEEEVGMILAVLTFIIGELPKAWPHVEAFLEQLRARLRRTSPGTTIKADITIGKKKMHFDGFTDEDTIKVITREYKVYFEPR